MILTWIVMAQWITLRPTTDRILTVENKTDRFIQCGTIFGIKFFVIKSQQKFRCLSSAAIIKGGVTIIVMEFFQAPCVAT